MSSLLPVDMIKVIIQHIGSNARLNTLFLITCKWIYDYYVSKDIMSRVIYECGITDLNVIGNNNHILFSTTDINIKINTTLINSIHVIPGTKKLVIHKLVFNYIESDKSTAEKYNKMPKLTGSDKSIEEMQIFIVRHNDNIPCESGILYPVYLPHICTSKYLKRLTLYDNESLHSLGIIATLRDITHNFITHLELSAPTFHLNALNKYLKHNYSHLESLKLNSTSILFSYTLDFNKLEKLKISLKSESLMSVFTLPKSLRTLHIICTPWMYVYSTDKDLMNATVQWEYNLKDALNFLILKNLSPNRILVKLKLHHFLITKEMTKLLPKTLTTLHCGDFDNEYTFNFQTPGVEDIGFIKENTVDIIIRIGLKKITVDSVVDYAYNQLRGLNSYTIKMLSGHYRKENTIKIVNSKPYHIIFTEYNSVYKRVL